MVLAWDCSTGDIEERLPGYRSSPFSSAWTLFEGRNFICAAHLMLQQCLPTYLSCIRLFYGQASGYMHHQQHQHHLGMQISWRLLRDPVRPTNYTCPLETASIWNATAGHNNVTCATNCEEFSSMLSIKAINQVQNSETKQEELTGNTEH